MAKTVMESLLCAEQHATGTSCLIPAVVLKGVFYYANVINGGLSLRKVK